MPAGARRDEPSPPPIPADAERTSATPDPDLGPDWADEAVAAADDAEGAAPAAAAALLYISARISADHLQDPAAAFDRLEAALGRAGTAPSAEPVLRTMRELALESGAVLAAIEAIDRELGVTTRAERRA